MFRIVKRLAVSGPRSGSPSCAARPEGRRSQDIRGLLAWSLVALTAGLIGGCGGGEALPPLHPVKGKVSLEKKPYTGGGTVTFHPVDHKKLPPGVPAPLGTIDAEGNYELKTAGQLGAPEGNYKVTVAPATMPGGGKKMEFPFRQAYMIPNTSPIQIQVPNPNPGVYNLSLKK